MNVNNAATRNKGAHGESEEKTIVNYGKVFALANIINRAAGLLLLPLYTHALTLGEYGVYALVLSVSDLLGIVFGLGFTGAFSRFYFNSSNPYERKRLVSTVFIGYGVVAFIIVISAYPIAKAVVTLLFHNDAHLNIFLCAIVGLIFTLLYEIEIGYAVVRKRPWQCFFMACAKAGLLLLLNGILVFWLDWGLIGIVVSTAAALGIITLIVIVRILSSTGLSFSLSLLVEMFKFGIALVPSAFANTGMTFIERFMLNALASPAAVGAYALAHRLGSMLSMFIAAPFSQIFFVRRFETLHTGESQTVFHRILLLFVACMTTVALGLSLFSADIIHILAPNTYQNAAQLVPWLSICFVLSALNQNLELGILYQNKPWRIAQIGFITLAISGPVYYCMIKPFGPLGAALALLIINIIRLNLTVRANKKLGATFMQVDWTRTALILIGALTISIGCSYGLTKTFDFLQIIYKILLLIVFSAVLLLTPIMDDKTRSQILSWTRIRQRGKIVCE